MKGPPLGPGGEPITWPDQMGPLGRRTSSTPENKPQTSRAHPGPSQTCAPFAPTMSVRIFGHFLPFPIFLAQRAICSAPNNSRRGVKISRRVK